MPSDFDIEYEKRRGYSGATNEFIKPGISPELQGIIDKVTGMSASPGRKLEAMRDVMRTVGGIEQQRMQEAGTTQRLGMMSPFQAGTLKTESAKTALEEKKVGIEGAYKGALTASMPSYMKSMFSGGIGVPEKPKSVLDEYPNLMDYF